MNGLYRRERLGKPIAQTTGSHWCHGAIQCAVKTAVAGGFAMQRLENFKVAERRGVKCEKIAGLIKRKPRQVGHVTTKMLRKIMKRRPRRADCRILIFQTK